MIARGKNKRHASRRFSGFTILELTVAMAILSVLIGMVFMISYNYLTMSSQLVVRQRQEMRNQAFLDWVRRSFGNLPGNVVWQIISTESQAGSSPVQAEMVLQEFPLTLNWNDAPIHVKAVRLRTITQPDNYLSVILECYDEEILDEVDTGSDKLKPIDPIATTTLIEDLWYCEWKVRDPSTDEWSYELKRTDSRPYQLELNLSFGETSLSTREVFWIPPKIDPKTYVDEMLAGNRSGGGRRGGGSGSGGGEHPSGGGEGARPGPPSGGGGNGGGTPPSRPSGGGGTPAPAATTSINKIKLEVERLSLLS